MGKIRKLQILIAMKFLSLKMQNFIAAKLNGFTVIGYAMVLKAERHLNPNSTCDISV